MWRAHRSQKPFAQSELREILKILKQYFNDGYSFFDIVTQFSMNVEEITNEHHFYQFEQQIKVIAFYQIYR